MQADSSKLFHFQHKYSISVLHDYKKYIHFFTYGFSFSKYRFLPFCWGALGGPSSEESTCNAGGLGLSPDSARSLGEGNGSPLQYSFLGNPMGRGALANYSP